MLLPLRAKGINCHLSPRVLASAPRESATWYQFLNNDKRMEQIMKKTLLAIGLAAGIASSPTLAQGPDISDFYAGGGLGLNSLSGYDNAVGIQVFGGYKLDRLLDLSPVTLAVEIGYMDTGDFKHRGWNVGSVSGLWASAVAGFEITPGLSLLGRLGLDFGDDDGILFGIGAGYAVTKNIEVRGEYVIREHVNSLQANLAYHF
jgi:hypothetical protein